MSPPPPDPPLPEKRAYRAMLQPLRRALTLVWMADARSTVGMALLTLSSGVLPAGQAWVAKLIIDGVTGSVAALGIDVFRFQHVKVAGIYALTEDLGPAEGSSTHRSSDHLPGFNLLGSPMVHFCPANGSYFVANVTSEDATYAGRPISRGPQNPRGREALRDRFAFAAGGQTQRSAAILSRMQTALDLAAEPVSTFVGSVDVIGSDENSRVLDRASHWSDPIMTSSVQPKASAAPRAANDIANRMPFTLAGRAMRGSSGLSDRIVDVMDLHLPPGGFPEGLPPLAPRHVSAGAQAQALALNMPLGVADSYPSRSHPHKSQQVLIQNVEKIATSSQDATAFKSHPIVDALVDAGTIFPSLSLSPLDPGQTPLALGISRKRSGIAPQRAGDDLASFVQRLANAPSRVAAQAWEEWSANHDGRNFALAFERTSANTPHIYANLDLSPDMHRFIETFGTRGNFAHDRIASPYRDHTADELYQTIQNPNLFAKTTYYFGGEKLSVSQSRHRAWDSARFNAQNLNREQFEAHRLTRSHEDPSLWQTDCLGKTLQEVAAWSSKHGFRAVTRLAAEMRGGLNFSVNWSPAAKSIAESSIEALVPTLRAEIRRAEAVATDFLDPAFQRFYTLAERGGRGPNRRRRRVVNSEL